MVPGARERYFKKGEERNNHFTLSSRNFGKWFTAIQFLSPPSCYCCFPLSSWSLRPQREVLRFWLCVTWKQCFCYQGNRSGTVKLGSREHLCPWLDGEGPESTASSLKSVLWEETSDQEKFLDTISTCNLLASEKKNTALLLLTCQFLQSSTATLDHGLRCWQCASSRSSTVCILCATRHHCLHIHSPRFFIRPIISWSLRIDLAT